MAVINGRMERMDGLSTGFKMGYLKLGFSRVMIMMIIILMKVAWEMECRPLMIAGRSSKRQVLTWPPMSL